MSPAIMSSNYSNSISRFFLRFIVLCSLLSLMICNSYVSGQPTVESRDTIQVLDSLVRLNRVRDNALARKYAKIALQLSQSRKNSRNMAIAYYLSGLALSSTSIDSAFPYYIKALASADSTNFKEAKARILFQMASIYHIVSDYKTALLLYDSCYKISEKENLTDLVAGALNSMGNLNVELRDSMKAFKQYQNALEYSKIHGLIINQGIALGNLAMFERDISSRIRKIKQAIELLGKTHGAEEETAQFMINLGAAETDPNEALKYYLPALNIASKANLHITRIAVLNNLAYTYLDLGLLKKAEDCLINQAIPEAKAINNSDWLATLYDSYADILQARNDYKTAFKYNKLAISERENADYLKASSQVRLLGAILDSKNKEIMIQKSNQAVESQKHLIRRQFLALLLAASLILFSILIFILILQRTRLKMKTQQVLVSKQILELEENEKAMVSRELHDTVTNMVEKLTGFIKSINIGLPELENEIQAKLKELSQSIRRISHRIQGVDFNDSPIGELIKELCFDMSNLTRLSVNFRTDKDFPSLEPEKAKLLYRITEELLNNASKYAKEASVLITLKTENGNTVLMYADDGPGFSMGNTLKPGIGLNNIRERARLLGGDAVCTSFPGQGVDWSVRFPENKQGGNKT